MRYFFITQDVSLPCAISYRDFDITGGSHLFTKEDRLIGGGCRSAQRYRLVIPFRKRERDGVGFSTAPRDHVFTAV